MSKLDIQIALTAIRAGYSEKTATAQASQNLSKLNVANRIAELKAERNEQVGIDAAYVLRRLTEIDQMDVADILLANTEVIAREKIYLTSLREPGTWLTVLHCKNVSLRPAVFTDRATTSYSVGGARRSPKAWIWEPHLWERVVGLRIQKRTAEWQTNPFRKLQFKRQTRRHRRY
ncbi:terminase small subunit [Edwardsiella tarda]|uniref:terminase small subunit n=1 Tax=Edwardsiella tarda TaxID=636 RepID=UPI0020CA1001|nr:terminase small subunit [Edwardsiella tarda]